MSAIVLEPRVLLWLANLALASCVACGVGLIAVRVCRARPAPLRHGVLLSALGLAVVSPVLITLSEPAGWSLVRISLPPAEGGPTRQIPVERRAEAAEPAARVAPPETAAAGAEGSLPRDGAGGTAAADRDPRQLSATERPGDAVVGSEKTAIGEGVSSSLAAAETGIRPDSDRPPMWRAIGTLAAGFWTVGTFFALALFARGMLVIRRLRNSLVPPNRLRPARLLAEAFRQICATRTVPVYESPLAPSPLSLGLLRPAVVLPEGLADELNDDQLRCVLVHEAAHLVRRDHWIGLLACLASALFWWNPLVRAVNAGLSRLREEICDDYVLCSTGEGQRFAEVLVRVAAWNGPARLAAPYTPALVDDDVRDLEDRITRLIHKERPMTTRMNRRTIAVVAAFALLLSAVLSIPGLRADDVSPVEAERPGEAHARKVDEPDAKWPDVSGRWLLRLPSGAEHRITLTPLGEKRYRLDPARLNSSGVYELRGDRLVIAEPSDPRLTGFEWRVQDANILVLVGQPAAGQTGADYLGATLVRLGEDGKPVELKRPSPNLSGSWRLKLPADFNYGVTLHWLGRNWYALRPNGLNVSGIYEHRDSRLVIVLPTDPRLTGFEWRVPDLSPRDLVLKPVSLELVAQPPAGKTGANYLGATLTKNLQAMASNQSIPCKAVARVVSVRRLTEPVRDERHLRGYKIDEQPRWLITLKIEPHDVQKRPMQPGISRYYVKSLSGVFGREVKPDELTGRRFRFSMTWNFQVPGKPPFENFKATAVRNEEERNP